MRPFREWLERNTYWCLSAVLIAATLVCHYNGWFFSMVGFLGLALFTFVVGVYDSNTRFTKEVMTEYERLLQRQQSRKKLRMLKGGKTK